MWLLTSIFTNWRLILCGLGLLLITSLYGWGMHQARRADRAEFALAEYKRMSDYAMKQEIANNDTYNKEAAAAHSRLVEQVTHNAVENFRKKFQSSARCPVPQRVRDGATGSGVQADSTPVPDGAAADDVPDPVRQLAEQCAATTLMVVEWQEFARNNLQISKE